MALRDQRDRPIASRDLLSWSVDLFVIGYWNDEQKWSGE